MPELLTPPPGPPSFLKRWMSRLAFSFVLLLILAVIAHGFWGWRVEKRLNARLAVLRTAGEPLLPADLNTLEIPDAGNAALLIRQAGFALTQDADWMVLRDQEKSVLDAVLPFNESEAKGIAAILQSHQATLDLVRQASVKPASRYPVTYASPMLTVLFPHMREVREVSQLLHLAALYEHHLGQDDRAFEHVRELLFLSKTLATEPSIVAQLVSYGVTSHAVNAIELICPDLRISTSADGAARRADVQAVIGDLLQEKSQRSGLLRALAGERVMIADSIQILETGKWSLSETQAAKSIGGVASKTPNAPRSAPMRYLLRPWAMENTDYAITQLDAFAKAFGQSSDRPSYLSQAPVVTWENTPKRIFYAPVAMMMPSVNRVVEQHYRSLASRRMAAIALAARLYSIDHGKLPDTLDQLVPAYLPSIPLDPFAGGGIAIRYNADVSSPRLYSVGENAIDNGGTTISDLDPSLPPSQIMKQIDDVVFLKRQPRPVPTTQE